MKILAQYSIESVATVFLGMTAGGHEVEFVESVQPPLTRADKEVIIVSSLSGCPVKCAFCDAGGNYRGKLTAEEILAQIDYIIDARYPGRSVSTKKLKIQFARIGEPSLNGAVLQVLKALPARYHAPGLFPSLSTICPAGTDSFFEQLLEIKNRLYPKNFQLQFSIHSTDPSQRAGFIPIRTWDFVKMSDYAARFVGKNGRKVALNFALTRNSIVDPLALRHSFDPSLFMVKLTPLNPTYSVAERGLSSGVCVRTGETVQHPNLVQRLKDLGYDVIVSIGELSENEIGSNCGQLVRRHLNAGQRLAFGYEKVPI